MIRLLILALLFYSSSGYCQYSTSLEKLYGFKKFYFKQAPSQIIGIKKEEDNFISQKNVITYRYVKGDIQKFNGIDITDISLDFYKNQLYQIKVCFGTIKKAYSIEEYTVVQSALINNFGDPYVSDEQSPIAKILNSSFWQSKNVLLNHIRLDLENGKGKYNSVAGYMLFTEKNLKRLQQNDEINQ